MKKIVSVTFGILLSAGTAVKAQQIEQFLNPATSRGYVMWEEIPSATFYKIKFFNTLDSTETAVAEFNVTNNYRKFDPLLFHVPNLAYTISAYSGGNLLTSTTTPVVFNAPVGGQTWGEDCYFVCNGRTYSWKLTAGGPVDNLSVVRLALSSAYQYFDTVKGEAVPYWQAVSSTSYTALPSNHPYKQATTSGEPLYQKKTIYANQIPSPNPYRDRWNNPVSDGYLIEKKLDEFTHLNGSITVGTAAPSTNICAVSSIDYWKNFYNQYVDLSTVNLPASVEPFAPTVPVGVECLWTYDHTTVDPGDILDNDWNEWVKELYKSIEDVETEISGGEGGYFGDFALLLNSLLEPAFSNDSIQGVTIRSIDTKKASAAFKKNSRGLVLSDIKGKFDAGLYDIALWTSRGNVFPSVIEFSNTMERDLLKEEIGVVVYPNPIVKGALKFQTDAKQAVLARLLVADYLGNEVLDTEITIDEDITHFSFDLTGLISSNYLVFNIIYPDGSVEQKLLAVQ